MPTRCKPSAKLLCAATLASAALLIAACGGSSSTHSGSSGAGQSATGDGTGASSTTEPAAYAAAKAKRDTVTSGVVTHRPLHGTGGAEVNDDNPGHADTGNRPAAGQSDPCTLVSRTQAQAIVGKPIDAPVRAPLGPTCIYRPSGSKNFVTVTVASTDFATIRARIRNRTQLDVSGHTSYCGTYGQPTVFVPLADGRVLTVTAPCATGTLFAAKALSRLGI
jgi:hypothetical protein